MKSFANRIYLLAAIACFGVSSTAMATAIGSLDVANCSGGGVTVSATSITWSPAGTVSGTGCIDTGLGTSVTYSGGTLGPGVAGNIMNLTAGGGSVDSFMTFSGTTLDFVLTGLGPGSINTACGSLSSAGQSCSVIAGSPFLLTYISSGVTAVSLSAFGTITDNGITSNWFGSFTTQLNMTAGAIQTTELDGGSISSTESGQFTVTAVPEPASVSMFALGGLALLGVRFRSRKSLSV